MARNKTISLGEDVFEKLASVDNQSRLVDNLLREYFKEFAGTVPLLIAAIQTFGGT